MRLHRFQWGLSAIGSAVLAIVLLAVANWPPLVRNSVFQRVEDSCSAWVVRALVEASPIHPPARRETGRIAPGRVVAFEPLELVRLWQAGRCLPPEAFSVLANTPVSYQWFAPGYQRWLLRASTEAAVALGVRAVIDASAADALRAEPGGRETAVALRRAGIRRAVIFDGAHHLPALFLEPELAILPVIAVAGTPYACHVHTRDAVSVPALAAWGAAAGLRTVFCTTPRLWTLAKTKRAMGAILARTLAACGPLPSLEGVKEARYLPPLSAGSVRKRNAWELYLGQIGLGRW